MTYVHRMSRHHVVLVPGFFGFGSLGQLTYFYGVREALQREFAAHGLDVNVVEVATLPTASIRHRAARVHETLARVAELEPGPIHIVGHSTGGLDARLAIAPGASLPATLRFEDHERLRTLISVDTPHFGTPLAAFFGSAAGYPLLRLLSGLTTSLLKRGRLPLDIGFRVGRWFVKADDIFGLKNTVADDFFERVISDFSAERRAELIAFIEGISNDQSLVFQLTAAGCDLLNASTADPDHIRYGSVVSKARRPRFSNLLALSHNPYAQTMHGLYVLLSTIAGGSSGQTFPEPVPEQRAVLERAFGKVPLPSDSDGIVPTLSQVWGEVIHAARADHLDVIGHYGSSNSENPSTDWLPTLSGFDDVAFAALWADVARFITDEAQRVTPSRRHNVGAERTQVDIAESSEPLSRHDVVVTADDQAREALKQVAPRGAAKPEKRGIELIDTHANGKSTTLSSS
jgi:triacylglycerol lipase